MHGIFRGVPQKMPRRESPRPFRPQRGRRGLSKNHGNLFHPLATNFVNLYKEEPMKTPPRGLGRGLSALFSDTEEAYGHAAKFSQESPASPLPEDIKDLTEVDIDLVMKTMVTA